MAKLFPFFLFFTVVLSSCNINKDLMFRTDRDFVFDTPAVEEVNDREYRLALNDVLMFRLFTNKGKKLNEFTTGSSETQRFLNFGDFSFTVLADGTVNFPELGFIPVVGLTIIELQQKLELLYDEFYEEPYISLQVMNNRVIVFPGSGGDARVIPIENNNVTVIEAIAAAGGIAKRGNASKVKLIRRNFKEDGDVQSKIYLMDLSTIEGIQMANMTVQSNDIIYVEPVPELGREILQELQPLISIVSGMALVYTVFILRLRSTN